MTYGILMVHYVSELCSLFQSIQMVKVSLIYWNLPNEDAGHVRVTLSAKQSNWTQKSPRNS